jgi:hypothetical protein
MEDNINISPQPEMPVSPPTPPEPVEPKDAAPDSPGAGKLRIKGLFPAFLLVAFLLVAVILYVILLQKQKATSQPGVFTPTPLPTLSIKKSVLDPSECSEYPAVLEACTLYSCEFSHYITGKGKRGCGMVMVNAGFEEIPGGKLMV